MYTMLHFFVFLMCIFSWVETQRATDSENNNSVEIIDLTKPTTWKGLSDYYGALEKHWKVCFNCGIPSLGTVLHLETSRITGSMTPAVIPAEYLLTRLLVVDLTSIVEQPTFVLTMDIAMKWLSLRRDPSEPTLVFFKFGFQDERVKSGSCVCKIPGISYELAEWITGNLTHVVGIATDAPTLESQETRERTTKTVSNLLGKNGIYIIENVNGARKSYIPERHCMAVAMPLKMQHANYVPTRLLALCPSNLGDHFVMVTTARRRTSNRKLQRMYDVHFDDLVK